VLRKRRLILIIAATVCSLILSLVPIVSQESPAQAANVNWTKYTGDVSLDSQLYVVDAWVIRDSGTYKMWYTRGKTDLNVSRLRDELGDLNLDEIIDDLATQDLEELLDDMAALDAGDIRDFFDASTTVIGYATSTNGIDWTVVDDEVLAGDGNLWDSVGGCCVIEDTIYKMWYTHSKIGLSEAELQGILDDMDGTKAQRKDALLDLFDNIESVIGYATSADGITWTVIDNEVLTGGSNLLNSVLDPCVIKDGNYKMWYTRLSTDLDRDDLDTVLDDTASFDSDAMVDLIDGTSVVIGYATSADGITWTVVDDEVLAGNPGGLWESVSDPSVLKSGGIYEMWYTNAITDLDRDGWADALNEIRDLNLPDFLDNLASADLDELINDLADLDTADLEDLLDNTSTQIGYATWDGDPADYEWTVQDADDLTGGSAIWSGIGDPCTIKLNDSYKIWYIQGIDGLTVGNVLDILQGTNLSIGYAYYSPLGGGGGGGGGGELAPEDYGAMDAADAAALLEAMDADTAAQILGAIDPDDAAAILKEMDPDDAVAILAEMNPDDAAAILAEMGPDNAVAILAEMDPDDAAAILAEMNAADAASVLEEMDTDDLEGIIPNMPVDALIDTLAGLTPDALYSIDPEVLLDSLYIDGVAQVPIEQLLDENPPQPPAGAGPPIVIYTTPSGARYLAVQTWAGEWVVVMGTPWPIEQLMIKTKTALENVETTVEVFGDYPSGVRTRLPGEQVAFAYFTIDFENITLQDIEMGHIKFKVDQEWLEDNSIHKWAVALYRYDSELKEWIDLPTKRVDEDGSYVYYTSPVPQFSIFAIAGSEDISAADFKISNLAINPRDAQTGQDITITADITNLSSSKATYATTLWIDNTAEAAQYVTIPGNQTKAVLFTATRDVEGSYEIRLDRFFDSFDVSEVALAPAAFAASNLTVTPAEAAIGEEVTISVTVTNTGDLSGSYAIALKIDADVVETKEITLDSGASGTATFTTTRDAPGTYSVTIDGLTGTFEVLEEVEAPPEQVRWWRIAVIATAVTITIAVPLYVRRRRMMA